ncbi:Citrate lyase, beta subunit [Niveomyces insectorum RCEF 264]|uniref:Citrate lyase, beta subunit n=1 Tax=Niveomyces insectorum RCEF 264 TaxID=1081102 RepID=A0A167PT70_9HYPO|nr:Citrate lyase, beta subunit [Niveomyces insectorum RCEF 264]
MLAKSCSINVDTLIYDLEDSVTPAAKSEARRLVADHIADRSLSHSSRTAKEVAVRINAIDTSLALDGRLDSSHTVVVPKVESERDLQFVADIIRFVAPDRAPSPATCSTGERKRPLGILALIESARALSNLSAICRAAKDLGLLSGIAFAAEDFANDLSLAALPDRRELLFARSLLVTTARAHAIPSVIDMVGTETPTTPEQKAKLEASCYEGRALGFTGKQCIHPLQTGIVQASFAPSAEQIQWATNVILGDQKAQQEGKGAWSLDGKMIDAPVAKRAAALLERARQCGLLS